MVRREAWPLAVVMVGVRGCCGVVAGCLEKGAKQRKDRVVCGWLFGDTCEADEGYGDVWLRGGCGCL